MASAPEKEHEWLQQAVGEWDVETEITMEPGQPPIKTKGTEKVRAIGGFWTIAEINGNFMDMTFTGVLTLGYDPEKKKYVGTWIDSMNNYMWKYVGSVDAAGKSLTLETKGPCPKAPGKLFNFKEVIEIKDKDHKVFTSAMQEDDGTWTTIMTAKYQRKK
jgi:Protein of unknown function (DUF1579)